MLFRSNETTSIGDRLTISADIPSQRAAQPQEKSIQHQYVYMSPGPVRFPKVLLQDNDH